MFGFIGMCKSFRMYNLSSPNTTINKVYMRIEISFIKGLHLIMVKKVDCISKLVVIKG